MPNQNPSERIDDLMKGIKKPKEVKSLFLHFPIFDKKEFMERLKKSWRFLKK